MDSWKWYIGFAPSIGWEMAFQARADLLDLLDAEKAPERFMIRRPSKLEAVKGKTSDHPILNCVPWGPKFFGALDKDGVGVLARNLFLWVMEASAAASEDWDREWVTSRTLTVIDGAGPEADKALAVEANARAKLARELKSPALRKV